MARIAVLGVGRMGGPVARRLTTVGEVVAFDPDPDRRARAGEGVTVAATQQAAVAQADVVVAVLPGAREQRGLLESLSSGGFGESPATLLVDLTSGDPDTARELQRTARHHGTGYVAAPMGGDPAAAERGALHLLVGGFAADVERALPVLHPLVSNGGRVRRISDDAGAASLAKLLVNGLWFAQAIAVAEAVRTAEHGGLPASVLRDVLRGSAADSAFVEGYLDRFLAGDEMTEFGLDRVVEELDTIERAHRAAGIEDGVLAASHAIHTRALADGSHGSGAPRASGELTAARWVRERHPGSAPAASRTA